MDVSWSWSMKVGTKVEVYVCVSSKEIQTEIQYLFIVLVEAEW